MQRTPSSGGRRPRTTGLGGGNANRRGSGLGSGPVGGGFSGGGFGGGSGDSSGGRASGGRSLLGTLLGLGAAAAVGNAVTGGGGNGNRRRSGGCLSRLITLAIIIAVVYFLFKGCSSFNLSSLLGGSGSTGDYNAIPQSSGSTGLDAPVAQSVPTPAPAAQSPAGADLTVSNNARARYTTIKGGGKDTVTIMVYMCGTDLESNYGMATNDLNEMLHGDIGKNVNIIVQTGGTKKWQNSVISNKTNQRYQIRDDGILPLEKDLGRNAMTDPATLTDFIQYSVQNYPANRYGLILWDHGGGSLSGYGYDEYYANKTMTLDQIDKALGNAGVKYDFLGFDACLMATYETALVAEKYADYLIASEETEPGCGWYYTNWLSELSKNTSMSTVQLGKMIVDDFVSASAREAAGSSTTLSVIDLAEMAGTVPAAFSHFAADTSALLDSNEYAQVSNARSDAREFAQSTHINQIDLVNMCDKLGTDASTALSTALRGCIKYNKYSKGMSGSNGLSIYFPYGRLSSVNQALNLYGNIGMDENYTNCIRSFASLAAGGQIASGTNSSPLSTILGSDSGYGDLLGSLLGSSASSSSGSGSYSSSSYSGSDILSSVLGSYLGNSGSSGGSGLGSALESYLGNSSANTYGNSSSSYGGGYADILSAMLGGGSGSSGLTSWLDTDRMMKSASLYDEDRLDSSHLFATSKNGGKVLKLSDKEWDLIQEIELNVFLDDGSGYIDLGMDNVYTFDDDLDLVMDYDRTWMTLNGQNVAYYLVDDTHEDDGSYVITGRIPALLNGERVNIMLQFTDEDVYGSVLGAQILYDADVTDTQAKGLVPIEKGDKIDFLCDYYDYNGKYLDSYMLGEQMTATGSWLISNETIGSGKAKVSYCLSDIYNNRYWTEALDY